MIACSNIGSTILRKKSLYQGVSMFTGVYCVSVFVVVTDYRELLCMVQLALEAKDAEENERKMSAQCSGFMHVPSLLQHCQRLAFLPLKPDM